MAVSLVLVDIVAISSAVLEVVPLLSLDPEVAVVLQVNRHFISGCWVALFFFLVHLGMVIYSA